MEKKHVLAGGSIVGSLVLLVAGMFAFQYFQPGKVIFTIQFEEANKLKTGDVMYAKGLNIGEVKSIRLDNAQRMIVAEVMLYNKQELPDDSFFFIWPDQLVTGSKCIQVKLGASPTMIRRGDVVAGEHSLLKIVGNTGVDWLKSGGLWLESMEEEIKKSGVLQKIQDLLP